MDSIQQRIIEIAQQIPEYVGYQAKERRRDADKLVRRQLASKYDEQRTRLSRISRQAPLDYVVDLENLDQKLQRLIARLNTAPGGYAGWFDAAQIIEGDLDQLTQFDVTLTAGVARLQSALDNISGTVKAKEGVEDAVGSCAELLDTLNSQFDQREQFLAMGKKPSLTPPQPVASPLDALKTKQAPSAEFSALSSLKLKDAISFSGTDFIVTGKISYAAPAGPFWAFLLMDGQKESWLRIGQTEISICQESELDISSPWPEMLQRENQTFTRMDTGTATVNVEGAGGVKRGSVSYARYEASAGSRLWLEDFGTEVRTMEGQTIDTVELKIYRK